jgi:hypothetical protein
MFELIFNIISTSLCALSAFALNRTTQRNQGRKATVKNDEVCCLLQLSAIELIQLKIP